MRAAGVERAKRLDLFGDFVDVGLHRALSGEERSDRRLKLTDGGFCGLGIDLNRHLRQRVERLFCLFFEGVELAFDFDLWAVFLDREFEHVVIGFGGVDLEFDKGERRLR